MTLLTNNGKFCLHLTNIDLMQSLIGITNITVMYYIIVIVKFVNYYIITREYNEKIDQLSSS